MSRLPKAGNRIPLRENLHSLQKEIETTPTRFRFNPLFTPKTQKITGWLVFFACFIV